MDEDYESKTKNSTYIEEYDDFDYKSYLNTFKYVFNTILVIALTSSFLIMYLLIRTKRLKRRTYIIFLHWLVWDVINILSFHTIHEFILTITFMMNKHHELYCIISGLKPWCQLISDLLMLILSINLLIKSKRISTTFILITLYSIVVVCVIIKSLFCFMGWKIPVIIFAEVTVLLILALSVIIKDLAGCYRKLKSNTKSVGSFRTNVVRIYVYNWVLVNSLIIFSMVTHYPAMVDYRYHAISVFLSTFYMLIYMVVSDKVYRLYLLKLLKCDFKYEEITETVYFDGSRSSTEAVNINIPDPPA